MLQWRYRRTLPPRLDDCGVLRRGGAAVALSALESRVMKAVLEQVGDVVSRERVAASGWPGVEPNNRAINTEVNRLRRKIHRLSLRLHTVRGRGYLLEVGDLPGAEMPDHQIPRARDSMID